MTESELEQHSKLADAQLMAKLEKAQAVNDAKLEALTRVIRVMEEQIKIINHRLSDLENVAK